ncbi:hypothetical protein BG000_008151, partial [Podila horticola]
TFEILRSWDPDVLGNHLNMDTLGYLVDKAITHLQGLSLPTRNTQLSLSRRESTAIKAYLDVHEGDDTESNLSRYITSNQIVLWMCQSHVHRRFDQGTLNSLRKFVFSHGGQVDMHRSTVQVELESQMAADKFLDHLTDVKHVFDISMKLDWQPTRLYIKELCLGIARTGTGTLEIDGITLDVHHQGHVQYFEHLFCDTVISNDGQGLQFVTLLNYPSPQEQCVHFKRFSLQSALSPARLAHSWVDLSLDLEEYRQVMFQAQVDSDCTTDVEGLQAVLEKHGCSDVTVVTICNGSWEAVFDLQKSSFVEAFSWDTSCPKAVLTSGSLRMLTVYFGDLKFKQDFFCTVQTNTGLEELNISYYGHNVLYHTESIIMMWHQSSSPFRLTLLDRMQDSQGRLIAQLAIDNGGDSEHSGSCPLIVNRDDTNLSILQQQTTHAPDGIKFLQWDCDHIFSPLSDYSASFLGMAVQQHPSSLTLFTLDVSQLSRTGIFSAEGVLHRSTLEHLHVVCCTVDPSLLDPISQVLGSVSWHTLKSLVLSRNNIDEWIKLWPLPSAAPQLLSLQIWGSGSSSRQELSHASVLFVHQLGYMNPLAVFCLVGVQLQNHHDWLHFVDMMDPEQLKTFDLDRGAYDQMATSTGAMDLFRSKFPWAKLPPWPLGKEPL